MHKGRIVWLGLPWLLSAALAVAVVWLTVELRQARREIGQMRQRGEELLKIADEKDQLEQSLAKAVRRAHERAEAVLGKDRARELLGEADRQAGSEGQRGRGKPKGE